MRPIDADRIVEVAKHAWNEWNLAMATQDTNRGVNKVLKKQELCKAVEGVADACPTIDPENLPVVRQLRAELALITHQRDVYKSVFERITAHGDCNDCGKVKECQFAPKCGEDTRYNCPLWRGPQKEE